MTKSIANRLTEHHLMDWGVLLLGLDGGPSGRARIDERAVQQEAELALLQAPEHAPFLDALAVLSLPGSDRDVVRTALERMCDVEHVDLSKSLRKLRAASVDLLLDQLPPDPVYGLIELSSFWIDWGPSDAPQEIQGLGNEISAGEYYTAARFALALAENRAWLAREYEQLRGEGPAQQQR
jgi:Uncharacterized protein conserved in bacteria (DUF2247)